MSWKPLFYTRYSDQITATADIKADVGKQNSQWIAWFVSDVGVW
ncbi:MAG: hypothetical protein R2816_00820 [Flavobacteriaceae bacterium]